MKYIIFLVPMRFSLHLINRILYHGIYDSQATKPSSKTELCIMMSQTELLILNFFF